MTDFILIVLFVSIAFFPKDIGRIGAKIVQGYEEARAAVLEKGF